jgi:hypothetical protein
MRTLTLAFATLMLLSPTAAGSLIVYTTALNGPNEAPPNASPGTGLAEVDIDTILQTMRVRVSFSNLTGGDIAAHIHCCTTLPFTGTAGVATTTPTFTGFPGGVTSGSYDHTFDLTDPLSYNPAFITAQGSLSSAEAALLTGLNIGETYLNIHTPNFPNGEIRGFLVQAPEPATFLLAGAAMLGFVIRRRH